MCTFSAIEGGELAWLTCACCLSLCAWLHPLLLAPSPPAISVAYLSALGFSLAQSGRRVLVLERDLATPDRIVGELLQPGGCASLRALGMGDCLDGIDAVPTLGYCTRVRLSVYSYT